MELNTEINKVFGMEMAKLFASTITEEEMMNEAKKIWDRMRNTEIDRWGNRKAPELEQYIKNEFLTSLHQKISDILKEPETDEELEKHARGLVKRAREIADESIVRDLASSIANNALSVYGIHDRFVDDVIRTLHMEKENGRL